MFIMIHCEELANTLNVGLILPSSSGRRLLEMNVSLVKRVLTFEPQGNHYDSRDYGSGASNQNSYHYSNQVSPFLSTLPTVMNCHVLTSNSKGGSYYYSNPNGSTYYNDGQGGSKYTK